MTVLEAGPCPCGLHRGPHWLKRDYWERQRNLEQLQAYKEGVQEKHAQRTHANGAEYWLRPYLRAWDHYRLLYCYRYGEESRKCEVPSFLHRDTTDEDYSVLGPSFPPLVERQETLLQEIEQLTGERLHLLDAPHELGITRMRYRRSFDGVAGFSWSSLEQEEEQIKAAQREQEELEQSRRAPVERTSMRQALASEHAQLPSSSDSVSLATLPDLVQLALFGEQGVSQSLPERRGKSSPLTIARHLKQLSAWHGSVKIRHPNKHDAWIIFCCYGMIVNQETEPQTEVTLDLASREGQRYLFTWHVHASLAARISLHLTPEHYTLSLDQQGRDLFFLRQLITQEGQRSVYLQQALLAFTPPSCVFEYLPEKHAVVVRHAQDQEPCASLMEMTPTVPPKRVAGVQKQKANRDPRRW